MSIFVAGLLFVVLLQAIGVGYVFARYTNLFARVQLITRPLGIDAWAGFGASLVFFVGFAWLAGVGDVSGEGEPMRYPVVLGVLGFAVGLFGVALALSNLGRYRRYRGGEFVAGVAESAGGDTVEAPLSGERCLVWAVRIRELSGIFRRGGPPPIHYDSGGTTFVVQSDTQRVRVDPTAAALDIWPVDSFSTSVDFVARQREGFPARVSAYTREAELGDPDRSRIAEEMRIEPGDSVTVFGSDDGRMTVGGPGTVVSGRSGETTERQLHRRVTAGPVGLLVALGSFGIAAVLTGAL